MTRNVQSLFCFLILIFCSQKIAAEELVFLELNHPNDSLKIRYSIKHDSCRIRPIAPIKVTTYNKKNGKVRSLSLLEQLYYGVEDQTIALDNKLSFSLSSLINAELKLSDFSRTKEGCKFNQQIRFRDQTIIFEKIVIHYKNNLNFPTLDFLEIHPVHKVPGQDSTPLIHNYQARGYFPFHELKVGLAVFNHTNIRPQDRRTFHQDATIHEPIPAFMVRYGPVFLNHHGLGSIVLPFKNFSLLTAFILDGEPYRATGLRERERSFYFGPIIKSHFFEFQYFREVMGIHSGEIMKFTLAPEIEIDEHITLSPRLYYQIWDKRYVNYYFGVIESELGSPLASQTYNGTREHNWGYFLRGTLKQKKVDYFLETGVKVFGGSVRNSPLTRKGKDFQLILGFLYSIF